jgi:hypothetical protein
VAFEGELCQHAAAEAERRQSLAERRAAYDHAASAAVRAAQEHSTGVDAFEQEFLERDPEAVAEFVRWCWTPRSIQKASLAEHGPFTGRIHGKSRWNTNCRHSL